MGMSYSEQHLRETAQIVAQLDPVVCEKTVEILAAVRAKGGRLFILGAGGGCGNLHTDRKPGQCHATHGGFSSNCLASFRQPSLAENRADEMGKHEIAKPENICVFLDRDGVLNRPVVRDGRPYPPTRAE